MVEFPGCRFETGITVPLSDSVSVHVPYAKMRTVFFMFCRLIEFSSKRILWMKIKSEKIEDEKPFSFLETKNSSQWTEDIKGDRYITDIILLCIISVYVTSILTFRLSWLTSVHPVFRCVHYLSWEWVDCRRWKRIGQRLISGSKLPWLQTVLKKKLYFSRLLVDQYQSIYYDQHKGPSVLQTHADSGLVDLIKGDGKVNSTYNNNKNYRDLPILFTNDWQIDSAAKSANGGTLKVIFAPSMIKRTLFWMISTRDNTIIFLYVFDNKASQICFFTLLDCFLGRPTRAALIYNNLQRHHVAAYPSEY